MSAAAQLPADWRRRRPRRAPALEIEPAADGFIVYQADRDRIHYLNHTAALLLEMCHGEAAGEDLGTLLARLYSLAAPPDADIAAALATLTAEGLVVWADADGTPPIDRDVGRP